MLVLGWRALFSWSGRFGALQFFLVGVFFLGPAVFPHGGAMLVAMPIAKAVARPCGPPRRRWWWCEAYRSGPGRVGSSRRRGRAIVARQRVGTGHIVTCKIGVRSSSPERRIFSRVREEKGGPTPGEIVVFVVFFRPVFVRPFFVRETSVPDIKALRS